MEKCFSKSLISVIVFVFMMITASSYASDNDIKVGMTTDYFDSLKAYIDENHLGDVTKKQLFEGSLKGIFSSMDQYTNYFTLDEAKQFQDSIDGKFQGIGVAIAKSDNYIIITKVFIPSPAFESGLQSGDKIVRVENKNVTDLPIEQVVKLIKGEVKTKVRIGILRGASNEIKFFNVLRNEVLINPVVSEIRGDIGYIKIDSFNSNLNNFITKALDKMDSSGIKKIVIDLRDDPGGMLDQAVLVAQKFVPKGIITRLDYKSKKMSDEVYYSYLDKLKYKIAVIVNGGSASASEVLAGAIQDTKAGTLIGTKTFGKAVVQQVIPILSPQAQQKYKNKYGSLFVDAFELQDKYGIQVSEEDLAGFVKMTIGEYTTPKGRMIDKIGIEPDIKVEDSEDNGININDIMKLSKANKPSLGTISPDVLYAKVILKYLGYKIEKIDLELDQTTLNQLTQFQKDNGLYPYGVLDFTTQNYLNQKLYKLLLDTDLQYKKAVEVLDE